MRLTSLLKILLAGASCFAVFACDQVNSAKTFEFYYYPSKNVYYDVANARYLYSLDGGANWDTVYKKITTEPGTLGRKQVLYTSTPAPWDSNEVHRKLYAGYLMNLTNEDSNTLENDVAVERKFPQKKSKPAVTGSSSTHEPEKKPGFFKRLFGKKH